MTKQLFRFAGLLCLGAALILVQPVQAQPEFEVGGLGLISAYSSNNVSNSATSGTLSPELGFSAGFFLGQTMSDRWGGEFRYTFFKNDFKLDLGGEDGKLNGQSHAIHYDVLYYFSDPDTRIRPYVAAGFGVKNYRGTGEADPFQPGSNLALLTSTSQTKPAGDFGAGVKFRVGKSAFFRVEFRSFVTGVPENVLTPAGGAKIDGLMWQWAPMFGFSWTF